MRIENLDPLDFVIRGGRGIDPVVGVDARLDVGIRHGQIVAPDLSLDRFAERRAD